MAMKSQVAKTFQSSKEDRLEKFKSIRANMRVVMDNKYCYETLYSIFEQYLLFLGNRTSMPLTEQNATLEQEIVRFKAANKNLLPETMWNKLLLSLVEKNQVPMYSAKNRVQRSFLGKLPRLLDEDSSAGSDIESVGKDVEQEIKNEKVEMGDDADSSNSAPAATESLTTASFMSLSNYSDNTLTYIDGYYELIVTKLKKTATDAWFSTL